MEKSNKRKKYLLKMIKVFWVIVIILTFCSKTISRYCLTTVRAEYPQMKPLTKEVIAEGNIAFKNEYMLYAPCETKILEVYVEEGEKVEKGQKLCQLDTSLSTYQMALHQLKLEENQVQLESNDEKIEQLEKRIKDKRLQVSTYKTETYEVPDAEQMEIEQLTKQVAVNEALYEEGACALKDLEDAKLKLAQRQSEIKEAQKEELQANEEEKKSLLEEITIMEEQVQSLEVANKTLVLNCKALQLEADQEASLGDGVLYAKASGVVQKVEISQGQSISSGEKLMQLSDDTEGYLTSLKVDAKIDFVAVGDEVELMIPSLKKRDIKGKITHIKEQESQKEISVSFKEEGLQGSEQVKVKFSKTSEEAYTIISYNALQKSKTGYFIYILEKRKSPLGEDYIVTRKDVKLIDFTESYAAIDKQLQDNKMILVTSEKAVKEGERVKVENETELLGAYEA